MSVSRVGGDNPLNGTAVADAVAVKGDALGEKSMTISVERAITPLTPFSIYHLPSINFIPASSRFPCPDCGFAHASPIAVHGFPHNTSR